MYVDFLVLLLLVGGWEVTAQKVVLNTTSHVYIAEPEGTPYTKGYRVYLWKVTSSGPTPHQTKVSPWHDIPMQVSLERYRVVCEIPAWTRAKFEVNKDEMYNPIFQDVKDGKLRYYAWGDLAFNYGMIPQTYEDPDHLFPIGDNQPAIPGDGDPVDIIEIGLGQLTTGEVAEVRILGALGMIDDNEMDWKIIVVRVDNLLGNAFHCIEDVFNKASGALEELREWWRVYKVAAGGKETKFAFNGEYLDAAEAKEIVHLSHDLWKKKFGAV
eukprot:TRINITY_DN21161_c0_g1_i1.p1 TRINITY_DN21161_c0_g1~~TRINITY_DN21161_c0_g1_i1.p1  ORF type:complete len:269 (-),score=27.37 TRINITY_DN21161_c0_g1_i1:92-898(-)